MPNIQEQSVGEGLDFSHIVAHGDSIYLIDPFTLFILHDGKITAEDHTTYGEVASINGQLVMRTGLPSFIITLRTYMFWRGFLYGYHFQTWVLLIGWYY